MLLEKLGNRHRTGSGGNGTTGRSTRSSPVVVVTGASAGVGRAVAVAFGREGWRVALIARGRERLASAARDVELAGGQALVIAADVADAEAIEAAAAQVVSMWGRIDIWINNAMVSVFGPVTALSPDEIRRVTEVTYLGQVHGTLAALRHMRPIAQRSSPCAASRIPCEASCSMRAAAFASRWCSSPLSILHSSTGPAAICPADCSRSRLFTSLNLWPRRSCGLP